MSALTPENGMASPMMAKVKRFTWTDKRYLVETTVISTAFGWKETATVLDTAMIAVI